MDHLTKWSSSIKPFEWEGNNSASWSLTYLKRVKEKREREHHFHWWSMITLYLLCEEAHPLFNTKIGLIEWKNRGVTFAKNIRDCVFYSNFLIYRKVFIVYCLQWEFYTFWLCDGVNKLYTRKRYIQLIQGGFVSVITFRFYFYSHQRVVTCKIGSTIFEVKLWYALSKISLASLFPEKFFRV